MSKPTPNPRQVKIVSSPRSKSSSTLKPVSFRLPPDQFFELQKLARAKNVSLSHLVVQAIERCKNDDIWRTGVQQSSGGLTSIVPQEDLVNVSNQLMAFAMVLEQMLPRTRSKKAKEHASRIYLDARVGLENLRHRLGC